MYQRGSTIPIKAKVVSKTDGSPIVSGVAAYHITATTRTAGAGTLSHVANGLWSYTPAAAETDYAEFAIEFAHADAVGGGPIVWVVPGVTEVVVQPISATVFAPEGDGGTVVFWQYAAMRASWTVDENLMGHDIVFLIYSPKRPGEALSECKGGEITLTFQNGRTLIELEALEGKLPNPGNYQWVLRDQTIDSVLLAGKCIVAAAPDATS